MKLSNILRGTDGGPAFWCPGCDSIHVVPEKISADRPGWTWNQNVTLPTFTPSILVTCNCEPPTRCHSFVTDGFIQFLSDSTHELSGKTAPIPDWPWAEDEYGGV